MEIDAMLADHAMVAEGKLFLNGAGVTDIMSSPQSPFPIGIHLGLVLQVPYTATNQQLTIRVRLLDADEQPVRLFAPGQDPATLPEIEFVNQLTVGRPPWLVHGDAQAVSLAFGVNVPLEKDGSYHFSIEVDGTEESRQPFRVHRGQQQSLIQQFPV
ncbi:DUF6941 family protein [Curtobacterium poinsettiae]|uniref:DUF6941 family protein n=1 Tax=Curtobacterium poinsettiae TaxID=159612 RepID=UPI001BDE1283|nr:hypothetical protein [Curtobacterium flaccumfaciens]MBT1611874.1 hypothetical protein [Curtobacterium flaccumfaciens pv. poinsettiae]